MDDSEVFFGRNLLIGMDENASTHEGDDTEVQMSSSCPIEDAEIVVPDRETVSENRNVENIKCRADKGELKEQINNLRAVLEDLENKVQDAEIGVEDDRGDHIMGSRHSTPLNNDRNRNDNRTNSFPSVPFQSKHAAVNKVLMKPQQYDGCEDFEEYISQFEILAELNNWSYASKSLYLAGSLSGSARAVLSELDETSRRDFKSLVEALKFRFGSAEKAELFRAQLQTRVRAKEESIPELAQSIRRLTRRAYPTADSKLVGTLALENFIESIPDADIRLRLKESRPRDINEAEIQAVRLETHRLADKQRSRPTRTVCSTTADSTQKPTCETDSTASLLQGFKDELSSLTKEIKALVKLQKQSDSKTKVDSNKGGNKQTQSNNHQRGWNPSGNSNRKWSNQKGGNSNGWYNGNINQGNQVQS
ncbi:uncharacterized protein LOC117326415 [Pecten maximus]|uniref:uncharacterized protein LOC117326415 n=1 Tax=Pecten maximus TaxID=6579 RepID=UPI001457E6F1|nr:uncharacterized protein LOC117326415 [Pecten maximus]